MPQTPIKRGAHPHAVTVLLSIALAAPSIAAAQTAPDAGTILQEVRPVTPPPPSPADPGLTIEQNPASASADTTPIAVSRINIVGAALIDTARLHALVADAEGQSVTFAQLGALADRITAYYREQGYTLAKAILPPQEIRGGVVTIEVIEARYGAVTLDNESRVSEGLLRSTIAPLRSGDAVYQPTLDRSLLLASDIPGVIVGATLRPGASVGASDLAIDVVAGRSVTGSAMIDSYGNEFTGRARLSGTVNFINPLRHGDVLSLGGLTSGDGLNYARIGYEIVLNGAGSRAGASYSALRYELGGSLEPLDAHGEARVASTWLSHPFVRSRTFNLYGHVQYDQLDLQDRIEIGAIHNDRGLDDWTISLDGDARDRVLSGGVTTWSIGWTRGRVSFDDTAAAAIDAATARTAGAFSKWSASLSRLQRLGPQSALFLAATAQWADSNLDSAEKMVVGGPYSVRAYDVGAMSGDSVYQGTLELRHALGAWNGDWQVTTFVDSAHVTVNETPWVAGANTATLTGAGVALNWAAPRGVNVRTYVAARIGDAPQQLSDAASSRAGIAVSMAF